MAGGVPSHRCALWRSIAVACVTLLATFPAWALDSVSLQLKWKHQFQFAGYYAALEQSFYRNAGLDVEIREGARTRMPQRRWRRVRLILACAHLACCSARSVARNW
jgi:hypothetical protein